MSRVASILVLGLATLLLMNCLVLQAIAAGDPPGPPSASLEHGAPAAQFDALLRGLGPEDVPDIFGPGAVLQAGRLRMKVTNIGLLGNPFPLLSSDPSGQWPNQSGVEYLHHIGLVVAATNPFVPTPFNFNHRVSDLTEWRPATLDPVDKIYQTHDGMLNGARFVNDDGDRYPQDEGMHRAGDDRIDEDFLDGYDNDLDGLIDEDHAALGDQEFTLTMRDDTPQAIADGSPEPHIPIGLECRQSAWCYSLPGFSDFDVVDYEIINQSGHMLDSLYVGWEVDMNAGPASMPLASADDRDLPGYPHGEFHTLLASGDPRRQANHDPATGVPPGQPLCSSVPLRVNGFSVVDGDGDAGQTPGVATFLLVDHTLDPFGFFAPSKVGFHAFRSYRTGTPWAQGGGPTSDSLRYVFMSGSGGVDEDGFVNAPAGTSAGDYVQYCSIGPFLQLPAGGSIHATMAFMVQNGSFTADTSYGTDYAALLGGRLGMNGLIGRYPSLAGALNLMATSDGYYEIRDWPWLTNGHGRETPVHPGAGDGAITTSDCHDQAPRTVTFTGPVDWFDYDCDYCTGPWNYQMRLGYFHHTWAPESPGLAAAPRSEPLAASLAPSIAPNPGRGGSRIAFSTRAAGPLEVGIFDVTGRSVRRLMRGRSDAGRHDLAWDGRDEAGHLAPAGVYLCDVRSGPDHQVGRLVLLR